MTSEPLLDQEIHEANEDDPVSSVSATASVIPSSSLAARCTLSKDVEESASDGKTGVMKSSPVDDGDDASTMSQESEAKSSMLSSATFFPEARGELVASNHGPLGGMVSDAVIVGVLDPEC